jgi:hypothetical protein
MKIACFSQASRRKEKDHHITTYALFVAHVLCKWASKRMLKESRYPDDTERALLATRLKESRSDSNRAHPVLPGK